MFSDGRESLPQPEDDDREQFAEPVDLDSTMVVLVPEVGLEPTCPFERRILSPLRLPFRHSGK